jgi:protein TonB
VIEEDGNISNVKVQRGITDCPDCDAEAVRVVKTMPKWKPAENDGKPIKSWFNLPIKFNP